MNRIGLSTGHSLKDPGGIGINGVQEYHLNLALVNQIMEFNLPDGTFYRSDLAGGSLSKDEGLKENIKAINRAMPLGAMEIHHNTNNNPARRGCWVMYWRHSKMGYLWASYLVMELQLALPKVDAVDNSWCGNKRDGFLKYTKVPALVFEGGFITNKDDLAIIQLRRLDIARAIREGTRRWMEAI